MAQSQDALPIWDSARPPTVRIRCGGEAIKPFIRPLNTLVDECRMRFTESGVSVKVVDPANVMMIDTTVHAAAFEDYDVDEKTTIGANLSRASGLIQRARVGQPDELTLSVSPDELRGEISRAGDDVTISTVDAMRTIDPESVRQEPDLPELRENDNDYGYAATTLPMDAFADVSTYVLEDFDEIVFTSRDGDFVVEPLSADTTARGARIEGYGNGVECEHGFSGDYVSDVIRACRQSRFDEVTLTFGHEVPYILEAERRADNGDVLQETTIMQAPRLKA